MRKKLVCALLMTAGLTISIPVFAAPSIGQIIPEAPKVESDTLQPNQELIVQDAATENYTDQNVAQVVQNANDENTPTTMKDVLDGLGVDTKEETRTNDNKKVNPTLYEPITPFVDVVIKQEDQISYETTGSIKVKVTFEAAKEREKKSLVVMQVDPTTGKVHFSTVEEIDKKTGEVTVTLETLGPIALVSKVPIVVKDTAPEKYEAEKVIEMVNDRKEETADISLMDILEKMTADLKEKEKFIATTKEDDLDVENPVIRLDEDTEVDLSLYTSAMGFADLAIKQGEEEYLYDMDGELMAEANRDITNTDWKRIVTARFAEFDTDAAEEDLSILAELEPFVVDGSIVIQFNPITGVMDIIYEPQLSFVMPETEEEEVSIMDIDPEAESETEEEPEFDPDEYIDDETDLMGWFVEDEDKATEDHPNLIITGEYRSMGPFALFLRSE